MTGEGGTGFANISSGEIYRLFLTRETWKQYCQALRIQARQFGEEEGRRHNHEVLYGEGTGTPRGIKEKGMNQPTLEQLQAGVIAQDDDNDYSEGGYVISVVDGIAYLLSYSHCSCFGTWDDGGPKEEWRGCIPELIRLAKNTLDPTLPSRQANPADCDYDHLLAVYEQVLEWDKKQAPTHPARAGGGIWTWTVSP